MMLNMCFMISLYGFLNKHRFKFILGGTILKRVLGQVVSCWRGLVVTCDNQPHALCAAFFCWLFGVLLHKCLFVSELVIKMPRHHRRKSARGLVSPAVMLRAAREVKNHCKSIRSVAKDFGINYRTLTRYCNKFTAEEISNTAISTPSTKIGYQRNRQNFTDEQEEELEKYILLASSIYFGLSPKDIRKIAFELAISNNLKVPKSWESNKLAGADWFTSFLKRHPSLSIRTPEATSLARATSFNQHNVKSFFERLESVIKRYSFQPHDI